MWPGLRLHDRGQAGMADILIPIGRKNDHFVGACAQVGGGFLIGVVSVYGLFMWSVVAKCNRRHSEGGGGGGKASGAG